MTDLWIVLLAAGLLTFLTRLSFISMFSQRGFPPVVMQALRFVPPAVLTAIVFPELLMRGGQLAVSAENLRLVAGVVAILVAWRLKRIFPTIAAGMLVLWALQAAS
jgi:branched-subunit amino acid transport protein